MENGSIYCRLCGELKSWPTLVDVERNVQEIISKLNRINAIADFNTTKLPKTVCIKCMTSLNAAFEFVLVVERGQNALAVLNRQIKQEVTEEHGSDEDTGILVEIKVENEVEHTKQESDINHSEEEDDTPPEESCSLLKKALKGVKLVKHIAVLPVERSDKNKSSTKPPNKKSKSFFDSVPTWKDYIWTCSICDTQFPTHDELIQHSMDVHKFCNVQRCYDCNASRSNLDVFIKHVRGHRNHLKYSCYKCHSLIKTPSHAAEHKQTHRPTNHICKGCNTTFKTTEELQDHISTYFRESFDRIPTTMIGLIEFTCEVCSKTFNTALGLMRHSKMHTERKRDHTCEICGKCFLSKYILKDHMVVHTEDRPFQCDICELKFKTYRHLRGHLRIHIAEKQFSCDQCGRSFKFKRQLETHLIIHTDSLPHVCSYCNKAFRFKSILNQHIRQHTGVKPYSCKVCHREFVNWPNYNKHMKRLHNMDMSKKKRKDDDEMVKSESVKKYVDSVLNHGRRRKSRPPTIKQVHEVVRQLNEDG